MAYIAYKTYLHSKLSLLHIESNYNLRISFLS